MKKLNRFDRMLMDFWEEGMEDFYLIVIPGLISLSLAWIFHQNLLVLVLSFLVVFLLVLIISMRISRTRNNLKTIIEKELIQSHYWYSEMFKSNMSIKITIEKIYEDGKVDFTVFVTYDNNLFENYLIGFYDKEQLTNIQIVNIECLKLPKIFGVLEKESISFYELHCMCSEESFKAEGITMNNQKVEIIASNEDIEIKIDNKTKTTKKLSKITNSYIDMESQGLIAATTRNSKMSKETE
ncbi:hypothetical protein [Enterococcus faecium]|uniref:hypothetical protein n=1 Tax=Enterococcus faecium TaxID=1352 RepID=UPI00223BE33E|nr:hypothetical protein [Enterococcus faecium]MCS8594069.1 hypothetical protein [Enterococcus faecium]